MDIHDNRSTLRQPVQMQKPTAKRTAIKEKLAKNSNQRKPSSTVDQESGKAEQTKLGSRLEAKVTISQSRTFSPMNVLKTVSPSPSERKMTPVKATSSKRLKISKSQLANTTATARQRLDSSLSGVLVANRLANLSKKRITEKVELYRSEMVEYAHE